MENNEFIEGLKELALFCKSRSKWINNLVVF
jgi:hypothetical protein